MIKIPISKIKKIEGLHKKWYHETIFPKLIQEIKEIDNKYQVETDNVLKRNLRKYLIFLHYLKKEEEELGILSNEKMIKYIEQWNYFNFNYEELEVEIKKIKKQKEFSQWQKEIDKVNKNYLFYFLKIEKKDIKIKETSYLEGLQKLFDYNIFSKEKIGLWNRNKVITKLEVDVCPYCQRNYVTSYKDNKGEEYKTTADLDHFYLKSKYPFLALTLYNFVPSCQICNSRMKGSKDTYNTIKSSLKTIYPYGDEEFTGIFKTDGGIVLGLMDEDTNFKVKIAEIKNEKTKKTIDMFKLDKIYESAHNKYLLDMINNIKNKPTAYLENIAEFFIESNKENEEKIRAEIVCNLEEIVLEPYRFKVENGEPLGKLTKDILEEFGIDI